MKFLVVSLLALTTVSITATAADLRWLGFGAPTHAADYCDQVARSCWSQCSGSGISCYQSCMIGSGCRP